MIIACATDTHFAELAGALLRSIAVNGEVPEAEIVVCGDGLSEREKDWLRQSASGLKTRFVDVQGTHRARIAGFRTTRHETTSTFTRLLLPDLLPEETGRILYLDADLIVNRSLRPLFELPLNGSPVAAVHSAGDPDLFAWLNRRVGRPPDAANFNAGVLVIDLDLWRELDVTGRCLDMLSLAPDVSFADQDALNAILGDQVALLDRSWNFWSNNPRNFTGDDYAAAAIIHFPGERKPNLIECTHPARDIFLQHRAHTPWRDAPLMTRQMTAGRRLIARWLWESFSNQLRPASVREIARAEKGRSSLERL